MATPLFSSELDQTGDFRLAPKGCPSDSAIGSYDGTQKDGGRSLGGSGSLSPMQSAHWPGRWAHAGDDPRHGRHRLADPSLGRELVLEVVGFVLKITDTDWPPPGR